MKFYFNALLLICVFFIGFSCAQESGGVKGKLRGTNERPLADATITARQNGKDIKSVKSDSKGSFLLNGLAPGVYNFVFEKPGFAGGVKYNIEIEKNKVADLGDRLVLTVDPGTLVFIKGSVFTGEGRSFPNAEVKIERIEADGKFKKVGSAYTNSTGEFSFRFPEAANKYRVTASAKGATDTKEIEVLNAAVYRLALTLNVNQDQK